MESLVKLIERRFFVSEVLLFLSSSVPAYIAYVTSMKWHDSSTKTFIWAVVFSRELIRF